MSISNTSSRRPAGEGERIAIGGYKPQYDAVVCFTLRALRQRRLQEIRLADLEVGRVDDLVLVGVDAIHGYQMKAEAGVLSFNDFVKKDGLLAQLAEGWTRLTALFSGQDVRVHLVSDQAFSTSEHGNVMIPFGESRPQHPHFTGFWRDVWLHFQEAHRLGQPFVITEEWQPAWTAWKGATGLTYDLLAAFSVAMSLVPFPTLAEQEGLASETDRARLYSLFQDRVFREKMSSEVIRFTAREIEQVLGTQFELCNRQDFPVSSRYLPLGVTVQKLREALSRFDSGYLAVLGAPGSGKSSLLTRTLIDANRSERVVRYYCFVPDEGYGQMPRGEAVNFLSDITLQIEKYGFAARRDILKRDLDAARRCFGEQLQLLSQDYASSGIRTVVVVDGLDHVASDADGRLRHPLLPELPRPDQVPEGVLILLGGQHLNGIDNSIRTQLSADTERTVLMARFDQEGVVVYLQASGLWEPLGTTRYLHEPDPRPARVDTIFRLSEGHPLALEYICQNLRDAVDRGDDVDQRLLQVLPYDGNIRNIYERYWRELESGERDDFGEIAGLLARQQDALDFAWMRTWEQGVVVNRFQRKFIHFFRRGRGQRWHFFHDSFRQFLRAKSMESVDGPDAAIDQHYYRQLAERCEYAAATSNHRWNALFHWWRGADLERVCQSATVENFDAQLRALRPLPDVIADARIGVQAAAALTDPVRLFRALLVLSGYEQREWNIAHDEDDFVPLLVKMNQVEAALRWTLSGDQLRPDRAGTNTDRQTDALRLCRDLAGVDSDEASRLFSLAEPVSLLRRGVPFTWNDAHETYGRLVAWADVAAWYRPVVDVIKSIRSLRWESDHGGDEDPEVADRHKQDSLLAHVASSVAQMGHWDDLNLVIDAYGPAESKGLLWRYWRLRRAYQEAQAQDDMERASGYLERLLREIPPLSLLDETEQSLAALAQSHREDNNDVTRRFRGPVVSRLDQLRDTRIDYAVLLYRERQDAETATRLIENISWFVPADEMNFIESITDVYNSLLQLCTLRTALEQSRPSITDIIPDPERETYEVPVLVARALTRLAFLRGERWADKPHDPYQFAQDATAILRSTMLRQYHGHRWGVTSVTNSVLPNLVGKLVVEASLRGSEALRSVHEQLKSIWEKPENQEFWPSWTRRRVLCHWLPWLDFRSWAQTELQSLIAERLPQRDVHEQVTQAVERARLSLELENLPLAKTWLEQAVTVALGVGQHKDYQFETWLRWAMLKNTVDPLGVADRVEQSANRLLTYNRAGGYGSNGAATLLLEVFTWSPVRAICLFEFLFNENCLNYDRTVKEWVFACLDADEPAALTVGFAVFENFVLPLADRHSPELPVRKLLLCAAKLGTEELMARAAGLWRTARIECSARVRYSIATAVELVLRENGQEAGDIGITPEDLVKPAPDASQQSYRHILSLRSGINLTEDDVRQRMREDYTCVARFRGEEQRDPNTFSDLDWSSIIKDEAAGLPSLDAIRALTEPAQEGTYAAVALAALAERAASLGDNVLARVLGEKSLSRSRENGWVDYFDGGSRKAAFKSLTALDPVRYRPKAFAQFGTDIASNGGKSMAEEFLELLPIFGGDIGVLCDEAEGYVNRLLASQIVGTQRLPFLHTAATTLDTPAAALILLTLIQMVHPGGTVVRRALTMLAEFTVAIPDITLPVLEKGLTGDELLQERTLMVCDAVAQRHAALLHPLVSSLRQCMKARSFIISETARRVLSQLNEECPADDRAIAVVSRAVLLPPQTGFDRDLNSERKLVTQKLHLFANAINYMADKADTPAELLLQRAARHMTEAGDTVGAGTAADAKARSKLMPYHFTYNSALAVAARRAVNYLANEMFERGELPGECATKLYGLLTTSDPRLVWWHHAPRPVDVVVPRQYTHSEKPQEKIEEDNSNWLRLTDSQGNFVLAETAQFRSQNAWWEARTISTVFWDSLLPPENLAMEHLFNTRSGCTVARYPSVQTRRSDYPIACMDAAYHWFDSPGVHWIAIFPPLARSLGLHPHPSQPFAWVNADGVVQIETVSWQEGTSMPRFPDPNFGWRVIAKPSAWQQIIAIGPGRTFRLIQVIRGGEDDFEPSSEKRWVESI